MQKIIPYPASITLGKGNFALALDSSICVPPGKEEVHAIGQILANHLRPATGYELPVATCSGEAPQGSLLLKITDTDSVLGEEGYELRVEPERVTLTAPQPAGLFRGIQTIRQLLPPAVEKRIRQAGPWQMDCCTIRDAPRFQWRGMMLDVARHFFTIAEVKRVIDQLAYYKMNALHLHLTDDQGWRLMINSWPKLAEYGGNYSVNGDPGGYYTQAEYQGIVEYARARYITILPEVDMPAHTNAALASYPELNESGQAPELYTGTEVGFSSFATHNEITYKFLDDVIREIAALTPGPYFHIGGDEAHSTLETDYAYFIQRVQQIVKAHGKISVGWEEVAKGELLPDTIVQYWWNSEWARKGAQPGRKFIMSPASHAYMDIKYDAETRLGQDWTQKYIEVRDAYEWDPATILEGVAEASILGIEAALWSETTATINDLDYMIFPRLPGYAEIGWTPAEKRDWSDYRLRLAAHGPRLEGMGINFYRSPQVDWGPAETR